MDSIFVGIIVVPGITALLLLLIFTYLYQQGRETYFRIWQLGWASLTLYYVAIGASSLGIGGVTVFGAAKLFQLSAVLLILVSTQLTEGEALRPKWYDWAIGGVGLIFTAYVIAHHANADGHLELEVFLAGVLIISAVRFYRLGRQRDFLGFRLIAFALAFWAVLLSTRQYHSLLATWFGNVGHVLGPLPLMLIGIAQVIVLYEHERRAVQDNTLYFSTLDVDSSHLVPASELTPSMQRMLERLAKLLHVEQAAVCVAEQWRVTLPSVSIGFPADFVKTMESREISDYLIDIPQRGKHDRASSCRPPGAL